MSRSQSRIPHPGVPGGLLTLSVGVASADKESDAGDDLSILIQRADDALYRAKHAGRDRVMSG